MMESNTNQTDDLLSKQFCLNTVEDSWAKEYDTNAVVDLGYVAPKETVAILRKFVKPHAHFKILDAACGTGLVGEELKKGDHPFLHVDGMDISRQELNIAKAKDIYQELDLVDMTKHLPYKTGEYDACICVGAMTHPGCLQELIRIVKPGGFNVFTVHEDLWNEKNFYKTVERLHEDELCEIVDIYKVPYMKMKDYKSYTVVLRTL